MSDATKGAYRPDDAEISTGDSSSSPATDCDACRGPIPYDETCFAVPTGKRDALGPVVRIVCAQCYGKGER